MQISAAAFVETNSLQYDELLSCGVHISQFRQGPIVVSKLPMWCQRYHLMAR